MSQRITRRQILQLGACAGVGLACPALGQPIHTPGSRLDRWYRGVCGQCGLTDPLFIGTQDGAVAALKGDPVAPTSLGRLCTRGMALPPALATDRRLLTPQLRAQPGTKGSDAGLEAVTREQAGTWLDQNLGQRLRDRPDSVAVLLDADLPCETQYTANRLLRGFLGCTHLDSSLRLDSAAGLRGATAATGQPAPLGTTADADGADLFLVVGADPAERHATLFYRMVQCQRRNGTRTVVVDPRRTLTCGLADLWIRPSRPGADAAILRAMVHVLLREGVDASVGLPGHEELVRSARAMPPELASELSGARPEDIEAAATAFADSASTFTVFGRGLMRGGVRAVRALYDLHAVAGRLGEGSTVMPLLEGANAPGAWLMGAPTGALPGLRRVEDPEDRKATAELWGCSADRIPGSPGLRLGSWLPALESGRLEAILLLGGNPLPRLAANRRWRRALQGAIVVHASPVQPTETSAYSDLLLPMALPWLEERGCFVSCDRRVQLTSPGGPPDGVPTSLQLVADLGTSVLADREGARPFQEIRDMGPELAWEQCRAATTGRDCDLSGMTYADLEASPGLLWPHAVGADPGAPSAPSSAKADPSPPRLSTDAGAPSPSAGADGDLWLVPIATSHHTSCRELTGFSPELHHASPRAWIEISGRDASRRKLRDGSWVVVESATGILVARLWITDRVPRGAVAVPDHFGFLCDLEGGTDGRGEPESLTSLVVPLAVDPESGQVGATPIKVVLRTPTDDEMAARALRRS